MDVLYIYTHRARGYFRRVWVFWKTFKGRRLDAQTCRVRALSFRVVYIIGKVQKRRMYFLAEYVTATARTRVLLSSVRITTCSREIHARDFMAMHFS